MSLPHYADPEFHTDSLRRYKVFFIIRVMTAFLIVVMIFIKMKLMDYAYILVVILCCGIIGEYSASQ